MRGTLSCFASGAFLAVFCVQSCLLYGQTREEKVRADKAKVESEGFWLYNDLEGAISEAKKTGKPILVVLRCVPCEECVKLDDEMVDTHPVIRPLMEKFVCVRIVGTNGLDLDTFQYDTDQSFAVFMLNADRTIYGRFGTRSHRTEWIGDVSLNGMAKALEKALELHANYPENREKLASKRGKPIEFGSPEQYPSLKERFTDQLNYEGDVVRSCIHCHQIGDARRDYYWQSDLALPSKILHPYPHPKSVGLIMDPETCATVKQVVADSPAAEAGVQSGDEIVSMNGQPLISIADIQWVLHHTSDAGGKVQLEVARGDAKVQLEMPLDEGWKLKDDRSWRVSSWGFGRIALGGMRLREPTEDERAQTGFPEDGMALVVRAAGKQGPHGAAYRQGLRVDDVIVKFDGKDDFSSEAEIVDHVVSNYRPGKMVDVEVLRAGKKRTFKLPIQE